jgi:hypothetical protein
LAVAAIRSQYLRASLRLVAQLPVTTKSAELLREIFKGTMAFSPVRRLA